MNKVTVSYYLRHLLILAALLILSAQAAERGTLSGGIAHEVPDWFKDSFLEISEDVEEAALQDKHVILFFQLNDCPYCYRMLKECFEPDDFKRQIQENFDVIGINVKGDREIAFNEQLTMTEKQLSEKLGVWATPSILFLDKNNEQVVRVNGYRSPDRFRHILDYVSTGTYTKMSLADYFDINRKADIYLLRDHHLFEAVTDLSSIKGPLAVIFEDSGCHDCNEFHDRLLTRDDVLTELDRFTTVRLDADAEDEITDPQGNAIRVKDWARSLKLHYRPGVVLFDQGREISRIESLLYSYHFKENLRYVGGGFHKRQDYKSYSQARREELLAAGVDINLSE